MAVTSPGSTHCGVVITQVITGFVWPAVRLALQSRPAITQSVAVCCSKPSVVVRPGKPFILRTVRNPVGQHHSCHLSV